MRASLCATAEISAVPVPVKDDWQYTQVIVAT